MWTIKKILDWSFNYFNKKKINQPKLSAELLLASVLNFTRMQLYLNYNLVLNKGQLSKFKEYVIKRANHMPVQYILKESHFRNLKLYVDENVLIPRPETELLVDKTLELIFENTFLKKLKVIKETKEIRGNKEPEAHKEPEEPEEPEKLKVVKEPKKSKESKEFEEFKGIRHILNIFNSGHNLNSDYNTFNIDLGSFYILEIGTGSGAIVLSIMQEIEKYFQNQIIKFLRSLSLKQIKSDFKNFNDFNDFNDLILEFFLDLKIAATEKSKKALDIAVKNYENLLNNLDNNKNKVIDTSKNKVEINNKMSGEKISGEKGIKIKSNVNLNLEFYNADIIPLEDVSFLEKYNKKINLVVSNPPYIKEENFPKLPQEVKDFEPTQALVAGKKGTEVYESIMKASANLVANDCIFIFETDPLVVNDLKEMLTSAGEFKIHQTEINIEKDYNLLDRIIYFKIAK